MWGRWWLIPGNSIRRQFGRENYRLTFENDDGQRWRFRFENGRTVCRFEWDHAEGQLLLPTSTIGAQVLGDLTSLCSRMTDGLRPPAPGTPDRKILDVVAANEEYYISGRKIRASVTEFERTACNDALMRLAPRFLTINYNRDGNENINITLPGLLVSAERPRVVRVIETILNLLRTKFKINPDFPHYTLDELADYGGFDRSERPYIWTIVNAAGLLYGGQGSGSGADLTYRWGTPRNVEDLLSCWTIDDYVGSFRNSTHYLPWPTAPRYEGEVEPQASESTAIQQKVFVVSDGADEERIVVMLPRGCIVISDIFESNSNKKSGAVKLSYHNHEGVWQGATHYHPSYRESWTSQPERQYKKLQVPRGDWETSAPAMAIDLAMELRERTTESIEEIVGPDNDDVLIVRAGEPIHLPMLDLRDLDCGRCRDTAVELQSIASSGDLSNDGSRIEAVFQRAVMLVVHLLGKSHPTVRRLETLANYRINDIDALKTTLERASALMWTVANSDLVRRAEPSGDNQEVHMHVDNVHYGDIKNTSYSNVVTSSTVGAISQGDECVATGTVRAETQSAFNDEQYRAAIKVAQKALVDEQDNLESRVHDALAQFLRVAREIRVDPKNPAQTRLKLKEILDEAWGQNVGEQARIKPLPNPSTLSDALMKNPMMIEIAKELFEA